MRPHITFLSVIERHIAALLLRYAVILMLGISSCIWLFGFLENMRRAAPHDTLLQILWQSSTLVLSSVLDIIPFLMGGAAFIVAGMLQRDGGLVALQSSGRAPVRTVFSFASMAALWTAIAIALFSPLAAAGVRQQKHNDNLNVQRIHTDAGSLLILSQEQIGTQQWRNVRVLQYDENTNLRARLHADTLTQTKSTVLLDKVHTIDSQGMPLPYKAQQTWTLDKKSNAVINTTPAAVSVWSLPALIAHAQRNGLSLLSYQLQWHTFLTMPLTSALTAALACVVVPRQRRGAAWIYAILLLALVTFVGYILCTLASAVALLGLLPVTVAVWSSRTLLLLLMGAYLFRYNERFY